MADGAISYYLDQFVVGRLVRYTYGTPVSIKYDASDPEHSKRSDKKYLGVSGVRLDVFNPTLFKVAAFFSDRALRTEPTIRVREYPVHKSSPRRFPVLAYSIRHSSRPRNSL